MNLSKSAVRIAGIALFVFPMVLSGATVGELAVAAGTYLTSGPGPFTLVNLSRSALAGGTLNSATVSWASGPDAGCTNAFKIKFFRSNSNGLFVVAERGPFNSLHGLITVTLTPPVTVIQGDFIGVTQLLDPSCGGAGHSQVDSTWSYATFAGDPASGNTPSPRLGNGLMMSVRATSDAAPVHGYLPVVGSTQGGFGALFKTGAQLANVNGVTISGRLVFHRAGTVGADGDPSVSYTLQPGQTIAFDDLVAATGTTGLGSMDLVTTSGYPPDVTIRIYDDGGAEGTAGFTEEVQLREEAFYTNNFGSLSMPADLTNFRMNVGVRTLGDGASISATLFTAAGGGFSIATVTKTYPANWFEQGSVSQFLGGATVPANSLLVFRVVSGSLFFYGATTDNRTNDGSLRFATKY